MDLKNLHFWFSEIQAIHLKNARMHKNLALIGGKRVVYTTCHETMDHGCAWPDMKYLGKGEYLRTDGKW